MEELKSVIDGRILNTITRKEIITPEEITDEIQALLNKINLPH